MLEIRVGDIYIRNKDGKTCRIKSIDNTMVVLESYEGKAQLILTDIFSLGACRRTPKNFIDCEHCSLKTEESW
jgi:hypothetical protein